MVSEPFKEQTQAKVANAEDVKQDRRVKKVDVVNKRIDFSRKTI